MKNISVDFTDVQSRELLPEGEYVVEVVAVEEKPGSKEYPYLNWEMRVLSGQFKGRKIWKVTSLAPKSLWVLRNMLDAMGVPTTQGKMNLNPQALLGLKVGVRLKHEEYDGKTKAKVTDVFPLTELGPANLDTEEEEFEDEE